MTTEEPTMRVTTQHNRADHTSQIRLTLGAGGPGEPEVIFQFTKTGVEVSAWNPWTNEWLTADLEPRQATRHVKRAAEATPAPPVIGHRKTLYNLLSEHGFENVNVISGIVRDWLRALGRWEVKPEDMGVEPPVQTCGSLVYFRGSCIGTCVRVLNHSGGCSVGAS